MPRGTCPCCGLILLTTRSKCRAPTEKTMKRDMDLVREILLKMEELPMKGDCHNIHIDGRSEEEIIYHVRIMHEAGLIEAIDFTATDGVDWRPKRLTYAGHEFLD